MSDIRMAIKEKTNEQLLEEIYLGPDAYQEGAFQIYLEEAEKRGLRIEDKKLKSIFEEKNVIQEAKGLLATGIILMVILGGLFAFIPGRTLLKKDKAGNLVYQGKYRGMGRFFVFWSLGLWIFVGLYAFARTFHLFGF